MTSPRPSMPFDPGAIDSRDATIRWPALEAVVHVDPAGRGLASFRRSHAPLDAGQLRAAALHVAQHAAAVGIVTGFCVVTEDGITAETDGPPGALFLARTLHALGVDVCLITDRYALPLLSCGCDHWKLDRRSLVEIPLDDAGSDAATRERRGTGTTSNAGRWVADFLESPRGQSLTHLIAIERAGPSHTLDSIANERGASRSTNQRFAAAVPAAHRDVCHSMRGESIDTHTAQAHLLFEAIAQRGLPLTTIGIGDGGNEIGMGSFDWQTMIEALDSTVSGRIVCRIATTHTLVAGVSDWAAYALALAVAAVRGATESGRHWNAAAQRDLIELMVRETAAVDGLTRRREPTIDGLPLDVYLRPLDEMRKLLGYADS